MLVSNDDFMPTRPANQNLIHQMKKKISTRELTIGPSNRLKSRTQAPNTPNQSSDLINADLPSNFQASNQKKPDTQIPLSLRSIRNLDADRSNNGDSFISPETRPVDRQEENKNKDISRFDEDDLPDIHEKSNSQVITLSFESKKTTEGKYNADRMYKKKFKKPHVKNLVFKEASSKGMDGINSLSSGYTENVNDKEQDDIDFAHYLTGFICGFFLSIFGVVIMLCCSKNNRRCEGATHGMIASGIVFMICFNGYIFTMMKDFTEENHDEKAFLGTAMGQNSNHLISNSAGRANQPHNSNVYVNHVFKGKVGENGEASQIASQSVSHRILLV